MPTLTPNLSLPRPIGTDIHSLQAQQALIDAIDKNVAPKSSIPVVPAKATTAQAQAGTDDSTYMTPSKTSQAITQLAPTPPLVTTTTNGLMASTDKVKLNGIATGAQVNPGLATTVANGLMASTDKVLLNTLNSSILGLLTGSNNLVGDSDFKQKAWDLFGLGRGTIAYPDFAENARTKSNLKFTATDTGQSGVRNASQTMLSLKMGVTYQITIRVRGTAGKSFQMFCLNANFPPNFLIKQITLEAGWVTHTFSYTIPEDGKSPARLALLLPSAVAGDFFEVEGETLMITEGSVPASWNSALTDHISRAEFVTSGLDNLSIGGTNYFSTTSPILSKSNVVGIARTTLAPNGFRFTGAQNLPRGMRIKDVITGNGWWTVSGYIRGSQSLAVNLMLNINDISPTPVVSTADNNWTYFSVTIYVNNWTAELYNFVDFDNIEWKEYFIKDFKVEKGTKATDWTPALSDMVSQAQLALQGNEITPVMIAMPAGTTADLNALPIRNINKINYFMAPTNGSSTLTANKPAQLSNDVFHVVQIPLRYNTDADYVSVQEMTARMTISLAIRKFARTVVQANGVLSFGPWIETIVPDKSTTLQAQTQTDDLTFMTPAKTKTAILANVATRAEALALTSQTVVLSPWNAEQILDSMGLIYDAKSATNMLNQTAQSVFGVFTTDGTASNGMPTTNSNDKYMVTNTPATTNSTRGTFYQSAVCFESSTDRLIGVEYGRVVKGLTPSGTVVASPWIASINSTLSFQTTVNADDKFAPTKSEMTGANTASTRTGNLCRPVRVTSNPDGTRPIFDYTSSNNVVPKSVWVNNVLQPQLGETSGNVYTGFYMSSANFRGEHWGIQPHLAGYSQKYQGILEYYAEYNSVVANAYDTLFAFNVSSTGLANGDTVSNITVEVPEGWGFPAHFWGGSLNPATSSTFNVLSGIVVKTYTSNTEFGTGSATIRFLGYRKMEIILQGNLPKVYSFTGRQIIRVALDGAGATFVNQAFINR